MARRRTTTTLLAAALTLASAALAAAGSTPTATTAQRETSTRLISQTPGGGVPNGPSTNAVISGDRRYARVIAFESEANDLVSGDTNAEKDVFAIKRAGSFANRGTPWQGGNPILLSRGRRGAPANGSSFAPSVDGNFDNPGRCVAFLSQASNLVRRDTNGKTDAFLSRGPGGSPRRVSVIRRRRQLRADSTAVAVAGDCSAVAFVAGGRLYVRRGSRTARIRGFSGAAEDPSFAQGREDRDLVFAAGGSVYLLRNGRGRPRRVARGSNPAYNGIKRQVVAYEQRRGENTQIVARDLGKDEFVVSAAGRHEGDASSRNPVVVNSGFYVAFESDASNLQTDANGRSRDTNGQADVYLYTDVRKITLIESVDSDDQVLGEARRPSPSFYANYIVFDAPAPAGGEDVQPQIFMRYLGGV